MGVSYNFSWCSIKSMWSKWVMVTDHRFCFVFSSPDYPGTLSLPKNSLHQSLLLEFASRKLEEALVFFTNHALKKTIA